MSDQEIKNWEERLKNQVFREWHNYDRHRIDLTTAQIVESWNYAGEFLCVEKVSSESALATIRLNRNTNDAIDLQVGTVIKTIFKEFYITNAAQPGEWIDIIIGINFEYYKRFTAGRILSSEAQQVLNLTHANPNANVAAAAHICNRALIKADVNNTQTAWIDFGVAAVQNNCLPLDPGEWIRVSISNTDRINANFEVGGEIAYIVYEV